MKKKILTLLCLVLLLGSLAVPALAAEMPRLVDEADLLADWEEAEVLDKLDEISTRQGLDIVIVTVPSLYGTDATVYADDFYDYNGYAPDGILLLISELDRQWAISTTGYGITVFTDAGLDYMADRFLGDLSSGWYDDAFHTFADLCDSFITQARAGQPYGRGNLPKQSFRAGKSLLISLAIGLGTGLIVTGIMRSQLKSVRSQSGASHYVQSGSLRLTESRDLFLYRQVHRQKRETSSGGSSTHRSSSGRSHGGSRGSF